MGVLYGGTPPGEFYRVTLELLLGLQPAESPKSAIFGINFPKGVHPLRDFFIYKIWREGESPRSAQSSEISTLWLLKCGLRAPKIVKIGNFSYKFAQKGYTP